LEYFFAYLKNWFEQKFNFVRRTKSSRDSYSSGTSNRNAYSSLVMGEPKIKLVLPQVEVIYTFSFLSKKIKMFCILSGCSVTFVILTSLFLANLLSLWQTLPGIFIWNCPMEQWVMKKWEGYPFPAYRHSQILNHLLLRLSLIVNSNNTSGRRFALPLGDWTCNGTWTGVSKTLGLRTRWWNYLGQNKPIGWFLSLTIEF